MKKDQCKKFKTRVKIIDCKEKINMFFFETNSAINEKKLVRRKKTSY